MSTEDWGGWQGLWNIHQWGPYKATEHTDPEEWTGEGEVQGKEGQYTYHHISEKWPHGKVGEKSIDLLFLLLRA